MQDWGYCLIFLSNLLSIWLLLHCSVLKHIVNIADRHLGCMWCGVNLTYADTTSVFMSTKWLLGRTSITDEKENKMFE